MKQKQTADLEVGLEEHKKAIFKRDLEMFSMVNHIQREDMHHHLGDKVQIVDRRGHNWRVGKIEKSILR